MCVDACHDQPLEASGWEIGKGHIRWDWYHAVHNNTQNVLRNINLNFEINLDILINVAERKNKQRG